MRYTADFETTTDPDDCRVWAVGLCEIGNPDNFLYDNSIDGFIEFCAGPENDTIYFHNLKFDGEFIIAWLFTHGFRHVTDRRELDTNTFSTLISDKGQFYSMTICFNVKGKRMNKVTLYDSLKILPFSVDAIAKGWGLPVQKQKIDYHTRRPKGHELTQEEIAYLQADVTIVALALDVLFSQQLDAMTQGSNALKDFKRSMGRYKFDKVFPIPDYDADIRQSYRGGFTYLSPRYKNKRIRNGIVLDVNSLYPSVMRYEYMPYGEGKHFEGRAPDADRVFRLYIQMLRCQFELKPGHIPTIQLKNNLSFVATEYATTSKGEDIILCLTCVDLALFLEHYDVYNIEWMGGWRFKAALGLFDGYIDKWTKVKTESKREGNKAMYTLAKLMLNALYGKFALNPKVCSRSPYMLDGVVKYHNEDPEMRDPIYIPVGTFVTSYSRNKTIRAAQSLYDRFIYADTDSLHLKGLELPAALDIDNTRLGAWKHEFSFKTARFIRQKTYIEHGAEPGSTEMEWKITCAGMPNTCYNQVNFRNFKPGKSYTGKLMPRHVPGGIVLVDSVFTIKN